MAHKAERAGEHGADFVLPRPVTAWAFATGFVHQNLATTVAGEAGIRNVGTFAGAGSARPKRRR